MTLRSSILVATVASSLLACSGGGREPAVDAVTIDTAVVAPGSLTFRLSYQSDVADSIYVQSGTEAGGQGWLSVRPAGGGPALVILDDCGRCDCASCGACPVCGIAQPEVTEIARGASLDWIWDARVFALEACPATGLACERPGFLAPGDYLAQFCWSFTSDGQHVGPLTCADESFSFPPAGPAPVPPIEHRECACG